MPSVTFLEQYTKEQLRVEGRLEAIESVLDVRFPDSTADLMLQVRQVGDLDKLHELLDTAKSADLATIRTRIVAAIPAMK